MRESGAQEYVFLTGSGRCGSSLVHEVLARHPDIGFISNIDDRFPALRPGGRANGPIYRRVPQAATVKGRVRFAPSEAYRLLAREVSPIVVQPGRALRAEDAPPWLTARFHDFFARRADAQGRRVFSHKFTGWPRAGLVQRAFPQARHLHIVRDGRAVANSLVQMSWWQDHREPGIERALGPDRVDEWRRTGWSYPALAGIVWKAVLDAHEEARSKIPDAQWLTIRYEDLLRDPRATTDRVLAFLDLPRHPSFERALDRMSFSTARATAYTRDLDPADLRTLEHLLAGHLERYSYDGA